MSNQIPVFNDPVELAVQKLIQGSYLANTGVGFIPIMKVGEIEEGDVLPLVSCETLDYVIQEDGVNASVSYLITIWDYFPDLQECEDKAQAHATASRMLKAYSNDLLEITNALVEKSDDLFPKADYTHEGQRILLPRYKVSVFESKVEANNSPFADRLIGATIQGRIAGTVPYICCSTRNFDV